MPENIVVVIARYRENLAWVHDTVPHYCHVIVMNKGDPIGTNVHPNSRVHDIPNIGRESEAYLRYILSNYDDLSEIIIFLQGDPFPHIEANLRNTLIAICNDAKSLPCYPISMRWLRSKQIPPDSVIDANRSTAPHAPNALHFERMNCFNLDSERYHDAGTPGIVTRYHRYYNVPNGKNIMSHASRLIGMKNEIAEDTRSLLFFFAANFAVRKASILQHDIDVYRRMADQAKSCPTWGFICERLWFVLFDRDHALSDLDTIDFF